MDSFIVNDSIEIVSNLYVYPAIRNLNISNRKKNLT